MAGVMFIVVIPRREFEETLRKNDKAKSEVCIENEERTKLSETGSLVNQSTGLNLNKTAKNADQTKKVLSKCKSSDYLHGNDKENGLYKSKSENILCDVENSSLSSDYKSYLKSSWEEMKQVMRPKRNKLKITSPFRGVDILDAFHADTPLETILTEVLGRLKKNSTWHSTRNNEFWQVSFTLESSSVCEETLQILRTFGVGSRYHSSISVVPCTLYYKSQVQEDERQSPEISLGFLGENNTAWSRFTSSVRARTNLAQVLHDVRADAALTFDWLFLLVVAAFVAAIGLVENSTVILVASMLISPLMGPITAGTLGTAVRDRTLQSLGVQNELFGLFLSLIIGFIFGLAICAVDERYGVGEWPTYEMMSRCEIRSLWIGVLVAIPSGAGVALAVLGEYTASLVGVAISASLLPPAVNAGLLWAMALVHLMFLGDETRWTGVIKSSTYSDNPAQELAVLGCISLCLTLVNIICIFLAGAAVYKVKEVSPLERRDISWWRANKGLLEATKSNNDQEQRASWNEIIDRWYKKENESQNIIEKENTAKNLPDIQSDTVTYRRRQLHPYKPKIPNIQDYLNQNERLHDHQPMSLSTHSSKENEENNEEDSLNTGSKETDILTRSQMLVDHFNKKYGFKNYGFDNEVPKSYDSDIRLSTSPVLEPSLSYTVDTKRTGLVLSNLSYDV